MEQVHEAIRRNYYSCGAEGAYVHRIKRFIYFTGKREPAAQYPAVLDGMRQARYSPGPLRSGNRRVEKTPAPFAAYPGRRTRAGSSP
jgi:hypothetical protein